MLFLKSVAKVQKEFELPKLFVLKDVNAAYKV